MRQLWEIGSAYEQPLQGLDWEVWAKRCKNQPYIEFAGIVTGIDGLISGTIVPGIAYQAPSVNKSHDPSNPFALETKRTFEIKQLNKADGRDLATLLTAHCAVCTQDPNPAARDLGTCECV